MRDARFTCPRPDPSSRSARPGAGLAILLLIGAFTCQSKDGERPPAPGTAGAPGATAGTRADGGGGSGAAAGRGGSSGGSGGSRPADAGSGGSGGGAPAGGTGGGGAAGGRDAARGNDRASTRDAGRDGAPDRGPAGPFALSSSAFEAGGIIVRKYRCQYENVSPPLSWTPGPATTRSYAITMRSAGSPHWALWDIPADVTALPEKIERLAAPPVPAGSKQCKPNVDGSTWYGYAGACPMGGTNLRPYYFELYALGVDRLPGVTPESSIREVNAAILANQVGMARLTVMASPTSP
jgi:Raf kinase inhibitor-like YbhB/YbcL family protein